MSPTRGPGFRSISIEVPCNAEYLVNRGIMYCMVLKYAWYFFLHGNIFYPVVGRIGYPPLFRSEVIYVGRLFTCR